MIEDDVYDLYGHALEQESLPQNSWNLHFWYTFPWPSFISLHLVWLIYMYAGSREEDFIEIMHFHHMSYMA